MYPGRVAEWMRVIGGTNAFEIDTICFMGFTKEDTKIQKMIQEKQEQQTQALMAGIGKLGIR
jgi:hypothetical protein